MSILSISRIFLPLRKCRFRSPDAAPTADRVGYTHEDERILIAPMARDGVEAVGSMGNDAPLAVPLQQAAASLRLLQAALRPSDQPPIDCIREELITSAETRSVRKASSASRALGLPPCGVEVARPHQRGIREDPRRTDLPGLRVGVLSILFRTTRGEQGMRRSMEELCHMARRMIEEEDINVIILSDRG